MSTQNGAKLLVDCLLKHGVKTVFGIPGAKVDAVFNELKNVEDKIHLVVCRHEQNAAFMAAIHGRLTGKPGVVIVTSGPGVTNLTTGLLTATSEGDPVIAIGANVSRAMRLKHTHQGLENANLMTFVSKSSVEVLVPESIPEAIENAFRTACEEPGGAAFISLPQDVLTAPTTIQANPPIPQIELGTAPLSLLEKAAQLINSAKKPILLLGMYASKEQNAKVIRELLHEIKFPCVGTFQAAGIISKNLVDCFIGRVGLFKNQPGDIALDAADVVITVGYNPVEYDPETWNAHNSNKKIISINSAPAEIHATFLPSLELIGDIAQNIKALAKYLKPRTELLGQDIISLQQKLLTKIDSGKSKQGKLIHPLRFIYDLTQCVDDKTTVISDIGTHYMWLARYFFCYEPRHLLFSNGQQTLGVALPWAISTRMIRPDNKIISISGDGGFLFSATELETAVREKCPFVHCVWRDGAYNMVLEQEVMKYKQASGVYFGKVDLVKFAESFGAKGYAVQNSEELLPTLQQALTEKVPVLIDIPIDYSDNPELFAATNQNIGN
ncbi:MAG: acetolactate synthase [Gammaproteobacteria bacterium RIFCSPHIGHO2_12_FULL_35_23]|nr:MAG: acetolactate synthase [Gammaproteobacteria bacterium RIFCSPHIGHO2_12_FULL_35_23]